MRIEEYIKKHKLLTDGAMGTYYAEYYNTHDIPELANTEYPERIYEIHRKYVDAGCTFLRTNTFASNTVILKTDIEQVKANIIEAVRIAKRAIEHADRKVYIAGDIGPIPFMSGISSEKIEQEYEEICHTFIEEGIDILNFETFPDLEFIGPVIERIKEKQDVFICVEFCVNQFGYSNSGISVRNLLGEAAANPGIDAYGLNCGIGPAHMLKFMKAQENTSDKYRICLPNAGYPKRVRNSLSFSNSPRYFAEKLAEIADNEVSIIGGCCGTNPEYMKEALSRIKFENSSSTNPHKEQNPAEVPRIKKGFLYDSDGNIKEKKLIAVELAPPLDANDEKIMDAANILVREDVDVVTFPDSPSGRTRADAILMAEKVKSQTNLEVMPHICCRDKNAIAIRSQLLGAVINGIRDFLVITGDPVPTMMRETVKSVFQFDSIGMMNLFRDLERDQVKDDTFCFGGAINQGRQNLSVEIKRVQRKINAGAVFFMTQPVFSDDDINNLRQIKQETGARILCGVMPLISKRNALFMTNEIAGIHVPDEIIERYPERASKEENEGIAVEIAAEIIGKTWDFADGYYFSFPFNRVYLLKAIKERLSGLI